jgi:hypothetical protein
MTPRPPIAFATRGAAGAPPPPTFARQRADWLRRHAKGAAGWGLALLLTATLVLQVLLADRARLAADAAWRPRLEALCGVFGCDLPPWREPAALRVTSREMRPHPSVPRALLVTASFSNEARFAQAWPQLELSLTDLDGQALGLRRFTPTEYLGSAPRSERIAPGQSAIVSLEIADPGMRALAYRIDFH